MNKKTLISALVLALGLGSLALPGSATARDSGHDGDRQEHSRDRGNSRNHDNNRNRRDDASYYGRMRWVPYIPQYNRRYHEYHHDRHDRGHSERTSGHDSHYDPSRIIHIETHL